MRSALAQPEVAEVLVVDDASGDDTLDAAASADDGTGRLKLIKQEVNQGPSAARNRAISESSAPIIALLDSDDYFLPGRFAALTAIEEPWDFVSDDIIFVSSADNLEHSVPPVPAHTPRTRRIDLIEFVQRNISKRGLDRSELGFLKPLIKREFLERHGLSYDEGLRLGEDFVLYAQALAKGAEFMLASTCGYGAIERSGSLSGSHSEADLAALAAASRKVMEALRDDTSKVVMKRHAESLDSKVAHRRLLNDKRERGAIPAILALARNPRLFLQVGWNVVLDKVSPAVPQPLPRRLFSSEEFEKT